MNEQERGPTLFPPEIRKEIKEIKAGKMECMKPTEKGATPQTAEMNEKNIENL